MDPLKVAELAGPIEALVEIDVFCETMVANPWVVKTGNHGREVFFRCVVRYDELPVVVVLCKDALDGSGEPLRFIPDRDADGYAHRHLLTSVKRPRPIAQCVDLFQNSRNRGRRLCAAMH